jgi:site-specific DNA recombinase
LAGFYRYQQDLIADAIAATQASRAADHERRRAELAANERELAKTGAAVDRYLAAFENGAPDHEDLAGRLAQLKARSRQLAARHDELAAELATLPAEPSAATRRQVADHISEIIASGSHSQRKALIETLVAQVKITGPGRIVPVFRIPQPAAGSGVHRNADETGPGRCVRAMTNLVMVELRGLEPLAPCLQSRCSSN